jgi:large subunit ribosomal protein L17
MRHGKTLNKLSRTSEHREALMGNLANSLIMNKRIFTTLAKAKALRRYIEPLLTKGKDDTMHNRRIVFSYLQDKDSVKELFGSISNKIASRNGGYTRVLHAGNRSGDNAPIAMIELVDFNDLYVKQGKTAETAKKTRRGRKSAGAPKTASKKSAPVETAAETSTEEKSAE